MDLILSSAVSLVLYLEFFGNWPVSGSFGVDERTTFIECVTQYRLFPEDYGGILM